MSRITTNAFLDDVRRRRAPAASTRCPTTPTGRACRRAAADEPLGAPSRSPTTSRPRCARCPTTTAPRSCCATSSACPTRRSPSRSASPSAPCAAASTAAGRCCGRRSHERSPWTATSTRATRSARCSTASSAPATSGGPGPPGRLPGVRGRAREVEPARSWRAGAAGRRPALRLLRAAARHARRRRWAAASLVVAAAAASVAFVERLPAREAPVKPAVASLVRTHAVTASVDGDPVSQLATAGVPGELPAVKSLVGAAALAVIVSGASAGAGGGRLRRRPSIRPARSAQASSFSGVIDVVWRDGKVMRQQQLTVEAAGGVLLFGGPTPLMALEQARLVRDDAAWDVLWPAAFGRLSRPDSAGEVRPAGVGRPRACSATTTLIIDIRRGDRVARAPVRRAASPGCCCAASSSTTGAGIQRSVGFRSSKVDAGAAPLPRPVSTKTEVAALGRRRRAARAVSRRPPCSATATGAPGCSGRTTSCRSSTATGSTTCRSSSSAAGWERRRCPRGEGRCGSGRRRVGTTPGPAARSSCGRRAEPSTRSWPTPPTTTSCGRSAP